MVKIMVMYRFLVIDKVLNECSILGTVETEAAAMAALEEARESVGVDSPIVRIGDKAMYFDTEGLRYGFDKIARI